MRKIEKLAKPEVLVNNEASWTADLLNATPGTKEYKAIEKRYGHADIRNRLRDETKFKCVYCESYIENAGYPHIEHIQPKYTNPHLTFNWENLTIGCHRCNVKKSTTEPSNANYVHPYKDDPEIHFSFVGSFMNPISGEMRAQNMINWLDLNRSGLIISRTEVVHKIRDIYLQAILLPNEARREFITLAIGALTGREKPYSRVAECTAKAYEQEYAHML
ncbi:MAG: hypothetical protein Devi2KO_04050 [Devosia indica]